MELGLRELITIGTVVITIASSFVMVKAKTEKLAEELVRIAKELSDIHSRIDSVEAQLGVLKHQSNIIGGILSPTNLKNNHQEIASLKEITKNNTRDIDYLKNMHNGKHPSVL